jgi:L-lactate permease
MLLPFYVIAIYGGTRSVRALWPVLLVAPQVVAANQLGLNPVLIAATNSSGE